MELDQGNSSGSPTAEIVTPASAVAAQWILKHIEVGRLEVNDGDVLVLRVDEEFCGEARYVRDYIREHFYDTGRKVAILMAPKEVEFQVICRQAEDAR